MPEWTSRDALLDASINVVPAIILAYFVGLFALVTPWPPDQSAFVLSHVLTAFPVAVLLFASFHVVRAVELDAGGK